MKTNLLKSLGLAFSLVVLNTTQASAQNFITATGTISLYDITGNIPDRGVCIKLQPALPGDYACLWKDNSLYKEMTDLLLEGFSSKKTCEINWLRTRGGFQEIEAVVCFN